MGFGGDMESNIMVDIDSVFWELRIVMPEKMYLILGVIDHKSIYVEQVFCIARNDDSDDSK